MFENIADYLIISEFSQSLFLFFIIAAMKKNKRSNLFLAFFILAPSLMFFSMFLHKNGYFGILKYVSVVSLPSISLAGVFMYFYTRSLMNTKSRFSLKDIIHFAIFAFLVIVFLSLREIILPHNMGFVVFCIITVGLTNSLAYLIYSSLNLKTYLSNLENYYSDTEKMNMNWLKLITILSLVIMIVLNFLHWGAFFHIMAREKGDIFMSINLLGLISVILIIAYHIVNMPEIFKINNIMDQGDEENETASERKEKYARQSLSDDSQDDILEKLNVHMSNEKPYLRDSVSIKDLSEELSIPAHHLSIVINNKLKMNFYNFINGYRVEEAKIILQANSSLDASILSIAFSVGFNSKSTFNNVFKKMTGFTPSEYRVKANPESYLAR